MSILVKIDKNLEFGRNFRYILILVNIVGNSRFWSKLTKMKMLVQVKILEK